MDPISGINRIVENLRRHIARKENNKNISSASSRAHGSNRTHSQARISTKQLKVKISERVANIDKNTANYNQEAMRAILESILVWEFGDNFLTDPEFFDMLTEISSTISTDFNTNNKMTELITSISENK